MAKISWEWIAGFFEGEGNVFWQEGKKGTKQGLHGRAVIGQVVKAPLEAIYDFLMESGFDKPGFYLRPSLNINKWQPCWILTISKRDDVIKFFSEISPYLFDKKEKAEYVIMRLIEQRNERDAILKAAFDLKNQGLSWREISRRLGVGRVAIQSYARSAGIALDPGHHFEDEMDWRDDRIRRGLCEKCGKPLGENATKRRCRVCADNFNKWRNEHRKLYGRKDKKRTQLGSLPPGSLDDATRHGG